MYDLMIPFHQEAWYYSDDQIQWIIDAFGFGDCGATSFTSENDDPCHDNRQLKQKEKLFGWGGNGSTKAPMQAEGEASASGDYMQTYYEESSSKAPQSSKCSSQQFAGAMSDAASVNYDSRASILVTVFLVLAM
jgi:hypothetical protein